MNNYRVRLLNFDCMPKCLALIKEMDNFKKKLPELKSGQLVA